LTNKTLAATTKQTESHELFGTNVLNCAVTWWNTNSAVLSIAAQNHQSTYLIVRPHTLHDNDVKCLFIMVVF